MGVKVMAGHEISFIAVGDGGRLQREQTQRTREEISVFGGKSGCRVGRKNKDGPTVQDFSAGALFARVSRRWWSLHTPCN